MDLRKLTIEKVMPNGINIIDHMVRTSLGLTCTEYCVFDTILKRKEKSKITKFRDIELHVGINPDEIKDALIRMSEIKLIKNSNNVFLLNKKMVDKAFECRKDELDKEFQQFWKIKVKDKLVTAWPGPKEAAFDKFKKARQQYSFAYIMNQRKYYFKFLEHETWRMKMIATKFLNIKTGQLMEDFKSQLPEERNKPIEKPMTATQKDSLYK